MEEIEPGHQMKSEREEVSGTYVRLYEKQTLARAVFVLVSLSIGR